jgi:hypothetical protein
MKYLKKIFEDIDDFDPSVAENWIKYDLLNSIDAYNDLLKNDKIWQDFYKDFENWRKSKNDPRGKEFLEEVIKFAENRLKEIKNEKQQDIELIKDLVTNYLEDCESFYHEDTKVTGKFTSQLKRAVQEYSYVYTISLSFTKKCLRDRRGVDREFRITENEIMDYWENLINLFKVLKSNGFESNIRYYQPNGVEMKITIQKRDED